MVKETTTKLTLRQVLSVLPANRNGKYECPACREWHLTVDEKDGKVLVHCFTPNCPSDAAWKAITEKLTKLKPPKDTQPKGPGLTLAQYAAAKQLPADWLSSFFLLSDGQYACVPAVAFPYGRASRHRTDKGTIVWDFVRAPNVKWRWGMGAHDRRWQKGAKASLYGQGQLAYVDRQRAQDGGQPRTYCFIVEGESDTQTTMYNNFAALGASGVDTWHTEDSKNPLLVGKDIYVIQEPGQPGEKFVAKVAASFPAGKVRAVKLRVKDQSELWIKILNETPFEPEAQEQFRTEIEKAMQESVVVQVGKPAGKADERSTPSVKIVPSTDIELKAIDWLWTDRIPQNKLTLFYGLPDTGKSTVAIDIIAKGTRGREMPDRPAAMPAFDVLVLASEDDLEDTYNPRLVAAGADRSRVSFLTSTLIPGKDNTQVERHTAFDKDMGLLERALSDRPNVRLVVLDPITSYLGNLNRNKDAEVRPLLEKFKDLAKRLNVTILAITFFNKNSEQASIHRISGAGAWAEVPRSLWAFVSAPQEKPNDETRDHLMLNAKLNVTEAAKRQGLRYGFKSVPVQIEGKDVPIGAVDWLGGTNITLDTVMQEGKHSPGPSPTKTNAAIEWLREQLTEDRLASAIFEEGQAAGHTSNRIRAAKERLGVETYRPTPGKGPWWWKLPEGHAEPLL